MKVLKLIILLVLSFTSFVVFTKDGNHKGQEKSVLCQGCHGLKGISTNTEWPNIANQNYEYLYKSINDYKFEKRFDPLMTPIAKTLSEDDIHNLAGYYSSIESSN